MDFVAACCLPDTPSISPQPARGVKAKHPGCWQPVPWCFTTGQWFCNRRLRVLKDRAAFSAFAQAERLRLSGVFVLTGTPTLVDSPVTVSGGVRGTQRRSLAGQHKNNTYLRLLQSWRKGKTQFTHKCLHLHKDRTLQCRHKRLAGTQRASEQHRNVGYWVKFRNADVPGSLLCRTTLT